MPKFDPSLAIKPLQQVSPAAFVLYKQTPAFVSINPGARAAAQHVPVTLALHDAQQHKFVYKYFDADPNILVPTGEIIIRPNLKTLSGNVAVQPASDKLFIADDTYVVVETPDGDVRLLSLTNGNLVRPMTTSADAFASWEVGLMSLGSFVSLLKV